MNLQEAIDLDIGDRSARLVWLTLHFIAKGADKCSCSVEDIALHTSLAKRTVQYAMVELERLKLVKIARFKGRGNLPEFSLKGAKSAQKRCKGFSHGINDMTKTSPYIDDGQASRCTLSDSGRDVRDLNGRLKVILRRKRVRDGYVTFLSMLDDGQFITASALAKELGMPTTTVRNDLMALFRSMDIPLDDQFRYRRSQRKPWHAGKMGGTVVPFYDRGRRENRG
jgi:DNA-binding transcriptional ArsR family regulator